MEHQELEFVGEIDPGVVGGDGANELAPTVIPVSSTDDPTMVTPSSTGRTELVGVPMTSSGPMSRGDDAEVMASGTRCPEFVPTYAHLDLDGSTSSFLTDDPTTPVCTDELKTLVDDIGTDVFDRERAPTWTEGDGADVDGLETRRDIDTEVADGMFPLNDEDPGLPLAPLSSSSSSSRASSAESDDEDTLDEVQQTRKTKKAKKKVKVKVQPNPPESSLSSAKSLQRLRRRCGIPEDIMLVAPSPADRADAPPPGYMTLVDQCLLWFPLPRFLMRFLAVHGVCLTQINPRSIRHLLGIYVLSRECGVVISIKHLSYLTDFRVRGRSEELKHTVTNSSGMALIAGFPSKDDHFEDRFLFVEISERTIEVDYIDLVKTRWERRGSRSAGGSRSGGGGSRGHFPGKILGRGQARVSFREQAALEAAAKAKRSSGTSTPRVVAPMTSTPTAPSVRARPPRPLASKTLLPPPSSGELVEFRRLSAERARISNGKGKGVDRETPSKRQRVDTYPAAVVGRETSVSRVGGVLRDEAYSPVKSKASELSFFLDRLDGDYDEDVCSKDSELSAAKEANAALIDDAVVEARDEMARGFAGRASEGWEPPDLPMEVKALYGQRHPIYDAHDVFADLLASVRRVLEIPVVSAGAAEASVAVDDDVEVSDEDDVKVTDDDEDAED
ncbi:hypothetical protein AALP_AA2G071900 [Arabis alpina]|uniref:Uncharacterized protein n=1 Tax=Arabis alpina TaxID=50452 RepID=A0A087HFU4_ARAAL|nr:hypothetical protein AALP_AA2G071900 [Arabis alpina]